MGPKRGRSKKKQSATTDMPPPLSTQAPPLSTENHPDPDVMPDQPVVLQNEFEDDVDTQPPVIKKKKPFKHGDLTEDEKDTILELLRSNPIIYNKQLSGYRDTEKKSELWRRLAFDLGRTIEEVTTFYQTARTALSRCKRKFKSGMFSDAFSVTDRGYWDIMQFLIPFIYEVKSRNVASFNAATARPEEPPCPAPIRPLPELLEADQSDIDSNIASVSTAGSTEMTSLAKTVGSDKSVIESVLVDFIKSKQANISSFALYMDERLQALDPNFRRKAQRRLSEVLDHVEMQQEQARSLPPFSDPGPQRWHQQEDEPQPGPSWMKQGNYSSWQGWQPPPSQWKKPTGNPASVWASQSSQWVESQYPGFRNQSDVASKDVPTEGGQTSLSRPTSATATDSGENYTILQIGENESAEQHDSSWRMGDKSFRKFIDGLADANQSSPN